MNCHSLTHRAARNLRCSHRASLRLRWEGRIGCSRAPPDLRRRRQDGMRGRIVRQETVAEQSMSVAEAVTHCVVETHGTLTIVGALCVLGRAGMTLGRLLSISEVSARVGALGAEVMECVPRFQKLKTLNRSEALRLRAHAGRQPLTLRSSRRSQPRYCREDAGGVGPPDVDLGGQLPMVLAALRRALSTSGGRRGAGPRVHPRSLRRERWPARAHRSRAPAKRPRARDLAGFSQHIAVVGALKRCAAFCSTRRIETPSSRSLQPAVVSHWHRYIFLDGVSSALRRSRKTFAWRSPSASSTSMCFLLRSSLLSKSSDAGDLFGHLDERDVIRPILRRR